MLKQISFVVLALMRLSAQAFKRFRFRPAEFGRRVHTRRLSAEQRRAIKQLQDGSHMLSYVAAEGYIYDTKVSAIADDGSWGTQPWPAHLVESARQAQAQILNSLNRLEDERLCIAARAFLLGCHGMVAAKADDEADRVQTDVVAAFRLMEARIHDLERHAVISDADHSRRDAKRPKRQDHHQR